jgi:tetratricopeptide (TPR) repeat protein
MGICWKASRGSIAALALCMMVASAPSGAVDAPDPAPALARPAARSVPVRLAPRVAKPRPVLLKRKKGKAAQIRAQKRSDLLFRDGYKAAHAPVMQKQDYAAGIGALRALGRDQHPDVANLLGFASRKLQRFDEAKRWYEAALAADPKHVRTWSYYGMWHAEQGNRLKAQDFLETVRSLCGNVTCREYVELKGVIDGTQVY